MNYGAAVDKARAKISTKASKILPDVCSFTKPGASSRHGYGYTTDGSPTTLNNVPCELQSLGPFEMLIGGQTAEGANGKLKVPANTDTMTLDGDDTGEITARGVSPAIPFKVVGPLRSSTDLWRYLAVTT